MLSVTSIAYRSLPIPEFLLHWPVSGTVPILPLESQSQLGPRVDSSQAKVCPSDVPRRRTSADREGQKPAVSFSPKHPPTVDAITFPSRQTANRVVTTIFERN